MSIEDLPNNLRILCGYTHSISETCRRLGINRTQFHKYLDGTSYPGLRNLRKICDYFGVEDNEILLDHNVFRKIISLRSPSRPKLDPFGDFIIRLHQVNPSSFNDMKPFIGNYYSYICPYEFPGKVMRSFVRIFEQDGFFYIKTSENHSSLKRRKSNLLRYHGIAYHTGDKIVLHEREATEGKMIWQTILYPALGDQFDILAGLTMGVASNTKRDIACYRTVYEHISESTSIKSILKNCGIFDVDSDELSKDIVTQIINDVNSNEEAFVSRPWDTLKIYLSHHKWITHRFR